MFEQIKRAVVQIMAGDVKRIDGDLWTAYAVGSNVCRIDIKMNDVLHRVGANQTTGLEDLVETASEVGVL